MLNRCDALVIGSGISGLAYALHLLKVKPKLNIKIVTKANSDETATKYAQGGIAVVTNKSESDQRKHIEDTKKAGDGLCDDKIVKIVVTEGKKCVEKLIQWGVEFDRNSKGEFDLNLEGGHSEHRILHSRDITGKVIEESLLTYITSQHPNIEILDHHFVIDLYSAGENSENPEVKSAKILNLKNQEVSILNPSVVLLASGGIGQVYQYTSNPSIATGDGIAIAKRLGIQLANMAFIQFHPTVYFNPKTQKQFLLTEAIRGEGGQIINENGEQFLYQYDTRGALAPRDIVSRGILSEIQKSKHVFLDMTCIKKDIIIDKFPTIYKYFLEIGINIDKTPIPVQPASHYLCGGIMVNEWAQTTAYDNLFAVGECACTGLHGANRLASNSLLEATVFARRAAKKTLNILDLNSNYDTKNLVPLDQQGDISKNEVSAFDLSRLEQLKLQLKLIMNEAANITRNNKSMTIARNNIIDINKELTSYFEEYNPCLLILELRNMIEVAIAILEDSLQQLANKGTFYNTSLTQTTSIA